MPFTTTIQLLFGAHTGGGGSSCTVDWVRQNAWISGTGSYISGINIISGLEVAYGLVPAQCNSAPLGLDAIGDLYLTNGGLHSGGQTQLDGTTVAQISTTTYPNGDFGGGGFCNVPHQTSQYMLDTGVGGGFFGELEAINVTLNTANLFNQEWPVSSSNTKLCPGSAGSDYGWMVCTGANTSITLCKVQVYPTQVVTQIGTIHPSAVDASWTTIGCDGVCLDSTDGNPILSVTGSGSSTPSYIIKLDKSSAAILWSVAMVVASPVTSDWGNTSILSQRLYIAAEGSFGSPPPTCYTINTSNGSLSTFTTGMATVGGLSQFSNDTLGCICMFTGYTEGANTPLPLNSTPSSWVANWAILYVAPGITPPVTTGKGKVYSRVVKKGKPPKPKYVAGTAAGAGIASGVASLLHQSVGTSHGSGTASGASIVGSLSVGGAAGSGSAPAISVPGALSIGSAGGAGAASGVSGVVLQTVGSASGAGTASAVAGGEVSAVGSASGTGVASGVSGVPSALTTMTLVNTSASAQASGFITPIFGMSFKKGDIPSGTAPTFTISGTSQPYSWGLQSYYSDGSLRHASFMFRCSSSIAGNGTLTVNINSGGVAPSISSRTLTEVYAQNLQVGGAGVGLFGGLVGTWNGYLTNDANNVEQYVYMDGQAGKSWRIKTHMAQTSGGAAHGQLEVYHYITALQDNSGNLGGFRHLGRITQPYYNNDTPTKALRAFASVSTQYGSGPTTINGVWPFSDISFTGTNGNQSFSGTQNLYSGAQSGSGSDYVNCVPGYLSATTDAALSTNQIYFAFTFGAPINTSTFYLSKNNENYQNGIISSGGSSTFVPIPICLHAGSIYTADSQGRSNFFQGTGSMSADNTVRTQFNRTYLHSTGAIPPWNLSVNGTAFGGTIKDVGAITGGSFWSGSPTWNPVSCGPLSPAARSSTGSNLEIGPVTAFHAAHFYNQSAVADLAVRAMTYASDYDGVGSFRDVSTGNYVNFSNNSYTGMPAPSANQQTSLEVIAYGTNGFTPPSTPPAGNLGFLWGNAGEGPQDTSHKPSMAFYGFLVFGEPHFYDLMIEAANGALLETYAPNRAPTSPAGYGIIPTTSGVGLRGRTWALRDLMLGAMFASSTSPDGSQVPQYLSALVSANIAWCNDLFSSTYLGSALAAQNSWRMVLGDGSGNIDPSCGGFQMGYWECVMAWLAALGDTNAPTWLTNYLTWLNYVLSNYGGYNLYAEYDGAAKVTGSSNSVPPITSLSQYGSVALYSLLSWTNSSPAFSVTSPELGYVVTAGDKYVFGDDQPAPPGGFSNWTPYYVRDVSGNNFNLAASPGGTAIIPTNTGSQTPGSTSAGGEGTPWLLQDSPPPASTGLFPNNAAGQPDSYLMLRHAAWNWAECAGVSGYSTPLSDAVTRLAVNPPNFTGNTMWYMQNSL